MVKNPGAFRAGRPEPEYPPAKIRQDAAPPMPSEPLYYDNARFLRNPSGMVMVEIKADPYNVIGPKPATDEDTTIFAVAWAAFQTANPPPQPEPLPQPEDSEELPPEELPPEEPPA